MPSNLQRCDSFFDDDPSFLGLGLGRWVGGSIFFTLAVSTMIFLWYQRKSAAALQTSSTGQAGGTSSTIFPAFEISLYLLVVVNIFTCILILTTDYKVGRDWSRDSFMFSFAIALQHVVSEGIAFMLMQKGCGYFAFKKAGCCAMLWGGVCYVFLVYTSFHDEGAFIVFMVWNICLWVFYLVLWFTPMNFLFRRPAAILFAKIFSIYHGLFVALIIYEQYYTHDSVACLYFYNTLFLAPCLQPLFGYYILLEDCRWWQGLGAFSKTATISTSQTTSPLHGFDVSLQSATALAKIVDHMGGAATATLINFSQISFDRKNLIGYGSFSKVYRGKFKNKECAVKLVYTMDLTEEDICRVAAEATILSSVNSINVVNIFGVTVLPPSVCVVLELCAYGSLSDVLRHPKALTLSFQDQIFLCLGCAKGVTALHALNHSVVHRDIKSFNFLVDHQLNAKLADLELGSNTDDMFEIKNIDDNSLFDCDFLANWIAPEVLQNSPYTQASDIYAMSLVFWEIFSKEIPYSEKNNISTRDAIINNLRPDLNHVGFQHCPEIMRNLIVAGWSEDPLVRPVASDFVSLIESIWLTQEVSGLSILESKSEDIMNKLVELDDLKILDGKVNEHDVQRDMSNITTHGNNSRLMSIKPLYDVFEIIENNDVWKIVRNLGQSAVMCSGTYPHMFLQCSVEWEQLTGYLNEHLFGYNMRDILSSPGTHTHTAHVRTEADAADNTNNTATSDPSDSHDSSSNSQIFDDFLSSLRTNHSGHCVVTIRTPIGTDVTISLHASPIFKSLYERPNADSASTADSGGPSWSGAVPYERNIAFYIFTATILTEIEGLDDSEDRDGDEDKTIFSKILRKFSVDGGSIFPPKMNRSSGRSSNRSSNRSSGRASSARVSRISRGGSVSGNGSVSGISSALRSSRSDSVDTRTRSESEVELSFV